MKRVLSAVIRPIFGVLCCAAAALGAALLAANRPWRGFVPIAFVLVIVLLAGRCGTFAGVLGTIVAALIFARFMLPPFGSFRVADPVERANLAWMVLGSVVVPFLIFPPPSSVQAEKTERK